MHLKDEDGQAVVEFALILPILLIVFCGIVDFGWIFANQLMSNNACREAARYTAVSYYQSNADDDRSAAEAVVISSAPTLKDPIVSLTVIEDDKMLTVSVKAEISVLTPLLSSIIGQNYTVTSTTTMRLE